MPDWLLPAGDGTTTTANQMLIRLVLAAIFGIVVAIIYRASHGKHDQPGDAWTLTTTLVLLAILIAMVSMVIGDSIARAFSLVGALSIVRFRTVVDDTRDTAFVIFAVIVGMAAGAGHFILPLVGIPVVGCMALLLSRASNPQRLVHGSELQLKVRLGLGRDPREMLTPILEKHLSQYRQISASTSRKGAAIDLTYIVKLKIPSGMTHLVTDLNQLEGVQEVELQP